MKIQKGYYYENRVVQKTYALIDCNNFFVSCERLFRPELTNRPVVVLSSNDGCAVSRSQEAKDLGIPMGAPAFKYRDFFKTHGVVAFSANFELYGDISERIVNLLTSITPRIEVYSVDESFLDLSELDIGNHMSWGRLVRQTILSDIGVPVSVGIAGSKTLTKAANHYAKKHSETGGVVLLGESLPRPAGCRQNEEGITGNMATVLAATPVEDIWGVGRKLAPKLRAEAVYSALDLAGMAPKRAQQLMGIHGRHMVYELNGTACLPLMREPKPQAMIMRGRQFGEDTRDRSVLAAAVSSLGGRAAAALRRDRQLARQAAVILQTNRLKPNYRRIGAEVRFDLPTADTGVICQSLIKALTEVTPPGLMYHKADVLLHDFVPMAGLQTDLFGGVDLSEHRRSRSRMRAFDHLNTKHGKGTLRYAAEDLSQAWRPRYKLASPRYTSAWSDLPDVRLV